MKPVFLPLSLSMFLLLAPDLSYSGQVVRIRIISAKDGQPLKDQPVSISLLYENTEKAPPNTDTHSQLQTDANGEAVLRLPEPPPAHLSAQVRLTSNNWRCACLALVTTQDVITKGFAVAATTKKSSTPPAKRPQPGEILFTAQPLTFFERLLEPLVKQ